MRSLQHLPERVAALFQDESGGKKEMAIKKVLSRPSADSFDVGRRQKCKEGAC
jgi:hypothetical protein